MSHEERIKTYYSDVVVEVEKHGLEGPIAHLVSPYALLRQVHEDGLDRPLDVSMNGMIPGDPNKKVISLLKMPDCKVSRVTASDGQGCYVIRGPRAAVMGSVAIALWYDEIVQTRTYNICTEPEKHVWRAGRYHSYLIAKDEDRVENEAKLLSIQGRVEAIIQKVNKAYGPQGSHINQLKKKLENVFDSAKK